MKERHLGGQRRSVGAERSSDCLREEGNGTLPCRLGGTGGGGVRWRWQGGGTNKADGTHEGRRGKGVRAGKAAVAAV
jgi:hypothetical protein